MPAETDQAALSVLQMLDDYHYLYFSDDLTGMNREKRVKSNETAVTDRYAFW
jgi:hypothetical protein